MKKNKMMTLLLLPLLVSTIAGCGDKNNSSTDSKTSERNSGGVNVSNSVASEESYSFSQILDTTNLIPKDILDADVEINFAVYVEGQNRVIKDIGNYSPDPNDKTRKYHPEDVSSIELAKYFGAAYKFKEIAPNVKINLMYCSINEYDQMVRDFYEQNGYFPELMWGTDHVVEMLQNGYNFDLNRYSETEYFKQYNEYFLSRFNFGGFQAGFPISAEPWGIFVNMDTLKDYSIVMNLFDENGLCTQEYKDWVDDFTWDNFVSAINKTTNETHAGLSKVVEYFTSYSLPQVNDQFIREGTVDLTSPEVSQTLQKLLNYENEISQKCVYTYDTTGTGSTAKDAFPNAASWRGVENFVKDEYCTFYAEAPWALGTISTYISSTNEKNKNDSSIPVLDTHVDFLPYPKVDSSSPAYTGIAVEGLTVGNQCPVGTVCTNEKMLKMDVASYFAMFMGLDPRSIEGQSTVKYIFDSREYTGSLSLPLAKRGNKFAFQEGETSDPAYEYDDNWQYQLKLWFDIYDLYVTNDEPADVRYFTNITYGLLHMLDSMYMLEGMGDDYVTCLNFWNEPVNIPDAGSTKDIFDNWQGRFTRYGDPDTYAGRIGTDTYVSSVMAALSDIETEINTNSAIAWSFLQECVEEYYGADKGYNVLDKDSRNSYEGSKLI